MPRTAANPETIAAIATAPGRGGIGIVRIAGPLALDIATNITGKRPAPRIATLCSFSDTSGAAIDSGILLFYAGPASFTGDDIIEFQGHGGPVVLDLLLERCLSLGARMARPGEFSERAYLNGKIDLAQAEAIADLIDSASREAARGAARSMQGEFSAQINTLVDELIKLRIFIEACIDFPEEEIDLLADSDTQDRISSLLQRIDGIANVARSGRLIRDGINVLLAGKPNAGKSSLLNALAGSNVAIVSAIAGTTRDLVRERILIDGMAVHITDTAGLRESPDDVEREGIRRALKEAETTDLLLLVVDSSAHDQPETILKEHFAAFGSTLPPVCIVMNKSDLSGTPAGVRPDSATPSVAVSALTGEGIDELRAVVSRLVGFVPTEGGSFSARRRHLEALRGAHEALVTAVQNMLSRAGPELVAEDLRMAQQRLGEITGQISPDELLGKIFASFCIGK
jgi:tRNA modification GTPase